MATVPPYLMRVRIALISASTALLGVVVIALAWRGEPKPESRQRAVDETPSFNLWAEACLNLPSNRTAEGLPLQERLPLKDIGPFYRLLDRMAASHAERKPWVERAEPAASSESFRPFAQKLSLPPGTRVIVHGDLHGDIRSLIMSMKELQRRGILEGFNVTAPNTHLVFLGDYTDRGRYGVEVLHTLFLLKLENPTCVWLTRGNHEDSYMIKRHGFADELQAKYGRDVDLERVAAVFEGLPVVIYMGCRGNFLQSCHGGMEPGYDPSRLLRSRSDLAYQRLGRLMRARFRAKHPSLFEEVNRSMADDAFINFLPENPGVPRSLGFLWSDFTLYQHSVNFDSETSRLRYGRALTQGIMRVQSSEMARVRGVLRAHQHASSQTPMMKRLLASRGLFRHWQEAQLPQNGDPPSDLESASVRPVVDGGVYTFNVSPDSIYGKGCQFTFQTFGVLTLAARFEDWRIEVVNLEVPLEPS